MTETNYSDLDHLETIRDLAIALISRYELKDSKKAIDWKGLAKDYSERIKDYQNIIFDLKSFIYSIEIAYATVKKYPEHFDYTQFEQQIEEAVKYCNELKK
jgi:hypothetical protein